MSISKKWLEPIGLALLLVSYGWQCFEEHSTQMKIEGYFCEINEKMLAIWEVVYDEALHSDRYDGKALSWVNYDNINKSIKDWGQVQEEMSMVQHQTSCFGLVRIVMYVSGSILVIISKIPRN